MPAAAHAYPLKKNLAAGRRRFSVVQLFQTSFKAVKNNGHLLRCLVGAWSRAQLTRSLLGPDAGETTNSKNQQYVATAAVAVP